MILHDDLNDTEFVTTGYAIRDGWDSPARMYSMSDADIFAHLVDVQGHEPIRWHSSACDDKTYSLWERIHSHGVCLPG